MVKVFVLYEQEPDPARFERHAELCRCVEGGDFRHGQVFGIVASDLQEDAAIGSAFVGLSGRM